MTIFEKIIARQIPAKIIWEDEDAIAFHDVDPQAPVHVLIVPKKAVSRLADATDDGRRAARQTASGCAQRGEGVGALQRLSSRDQLRT